MRGLTASFARIFAVALFILSTDAAADTQQIPISTASEADWLSGVQHAIPCVTTSRETLQALIAGFTVPIPPEIKG